LEELPGKSNYFIGNDPKKWRTNVPNYAKVKYQGIYPNIDLVYYGNQRQLEYDFVVAPGADPNAIAPSFDDVETVREPPGAHRDVSLRIDRNGDLVISTGAGDVRFHKPIVYQPFHNIDQSAITNRRSLNGSYVLTASNRVSFEIATYDKSKPLIIDPVLSYSTYLGGGGDDSGNGIAIDASGNAYITGYTTPLNFPITSSTFQTSFGGGAHDAFVSKFNAAGSALLYSTYLGGGDTDAGEALAIDSAGNAYVSGWTNSWDFPTVNPVQANYKGNGDVFVAKLNPEGSTLVYSPYLGGGYVENGSGIAVDSAGYTYVTGVTESWDFPTTPGAFQPTAPPRCGNPSNWCKDAFVTKLSPTGSSLVYSTFLGGTGENMGRAVAMNSTGHAYVTSSISSSDFPTAKSIQAVLDGESCYGRYSCTDAFVSELNSSGSSLVYSTYLGGGAIDFGAGIAVDGSGGVYVTGLTMSTDFPTKNPIPGACMGTCGKGSGSETFVTKLSVDGSVLSLVYSTYLGGTNRGGCYYNQDGWLACSNGDRGNGMIVDSSGNVHVTGVTFSSDFPATNPIQAANAGSGDTFVTKLNALGSACSTPLSWAEVLSTMALPLRWTPRAMPTSRATPPRRISL
jgi:hypothetical protein